MNINNVNSVQIGLASPERILEWSYGEVTKPETINYRSQKAEPEGLFAEKIFGPTKDWECACGKYKKVKYKGAVCDRCGVEITRSAVRRERMGHIQLATPVSHIWYLKGTPSRMALVLNMKARDLEEIAYFVKYVVIDPKDTDLDYKLVLSQEEYEQSCTAYGPKAFVAKSGAEAIKILLEEVDLQKEHDSIVADLEKAQNERRKALLKRLETIDAFINSNQKPEWMILTVLPVIPPDLRPMLQLDGGRFATSDLNDLYRRIITRNNRLRKEQEQCTPNIVIQNEKRMLQEAVDALIDNGRRSKAVTGSNGRALKSLSTSLKGKQGRFRQNCLGKRVDYSGRSVIAVGPDLRMNQCGLPREMALSLFKPFVMNKLVMNGIVNNAKAADKLIERLDPRVWDIVEEVIQGHPVLLNRAPTLHRLGIQAFMPKIVEGRAIRLHPLVCTAFNADFDGDQMAVHVPLSEEAQAEARILMLGSNNILGPKDGKPIVTPSQDMVLGNFYLTMEESKEEFYAQADRLEKLGDYKQAELWKRYGDSEGRVYKDVDEVLMAYDKKQTHLHTRIALRASSLNKTFFTDEQNEKYLITTVGKIIFNSIFPSDFPYVNEVKGDWNKKTPDEYFAPAGTNIPEYVASMKEHSPVIKKHLGAVIAEVYARYSKDENTYIYFDAIKDNGFKYSTVAGMTISIDDIKVAPNKEKYVEEGKTKADKLKALYRRGLLTEQEWERQLQQIWDGIKNTIGDELMESLPKKNPINMMAVSGARGNKNHFTQLAGMRGIMGKPAQAKSAKGYQSTIIEVPIYSNFREGLDVSEFFISSHGIRKGLTDTALKTASSGYLTRRLVDVAQDVTITTDDCHTDKGYPVEALIDPKDGGVIEKLEDRLFGRFAKEDVCDPQTGELIVASDEYIDEKTAKKIVGTGIKKMLIRNAFTCDCEHGICAKCYGRNMATGNFVEVGEAVGIMAAQSIGEPGTQLTMRNFHTGGVANAGGDITQGLPRVEELFEARCPKHPSLLAAQAGTITKIEHDENGNNQITIQPENGDSYILKTDPTQVLFRNYVEGVKVEAGEQLTEGHLNPKELILVAGVEKVQNYILREVKKVYASQSIDIADTHLEVMICQMLRKVVITDEGDTHIAIGTQISKSKITEINNKMFEEGLTPAQFRPTLLAISKSSVEADSWLSAASFQETTKVLTDAAINGKIDYLTGIKENVILGKKIPAGTGCDFERTSTIKVKELAEQLKVEKLELLKKANEETETMEANIELPEVEEEILPEEE